MLYRKKKLHFTCNNDIFTSDAATKYTNATLCRYAHLKTVAELLIQYFSN